MRSLLLLLPLLLPLALAGPAQARRRLGSRERALTLLSRAPRRSAWKHVRWCDVRDRALELIKNPDALDQASLHLCGGACVLNGVARRDPLRFAKLVRDIFERGHVGRRRVSKRLLDAEPGGAKTFDWMLLSALRNAYGRPRFAGQSGFRVSAINLPSDVKRWAVEIAGARSLRSYRSYLRSGTRHIGRINRALGRGDEVYALMHMKGIRNTQGHDLHWVRLLSPIEPAGAAGVTFRIFDRGKALRARLSREELGANLLHTIVAEMN
ncbi:MAG: hypothetical protein KC503_43395 [Myxococcales bacterium]|nr:hypothetical protein [Myxococcales bacterium]